MPDRLLSFWLGFQRIGGIGGARIGLLERAFGNLEIAWRASAQDLVHAGLPASVAATVVRERSTIDLDAELELLERHDIHVIRMSDSAYPAALKEIQAPPSGLFVQGALLPADELAIAVVGTRRATAYGRDMTRRFSHDLAEAGVTVISGLALGVDTIAHTAALDAGGRTLAVSGCGLDQVYPAPNRRLAERIRAQGALISEYPPGVGPSAQHFPARNRIVSGMSRGVLVVEAPASSGALITSTFAADQGRDVYAVPGSALSTMSDGCHALIRTGAMLVTSAADILEVLVVEHVREQHQMRMEFPLAPDERRMLNLIGAEPRHVDDLADESGLQISIAAATLLTLELKGMVRQSGPQLYVQR